MKKSISPRNSKHYSPDIFEGLTFSLSKTSDFNENSFEKTGKVNSNN